MSPLELALVLAVLAFGVNTMFWSVIGAGRALSDQLPRRRTGRHRVRRQVAPPTVADVAILIAAHNEASVIVTTIRSACRLVTADQVFVVSDGSTDATASIAREHGVHVLELDPNRGKAGALAFGFAEFELADRAEIVVLLDADTELADEYLITGLAVFADPEVACVAGRAATQWELPVQDWRSRMIIAHRERSYVLMQRLLKYGQAARFADVVAIAPGFASMYRSSVMSQIKLDPIGLVIEDFNMTFEVHRHKLGRVAFNPGAAVALTQDPDRLVDYRKQVSRWALGFWQTVRLHGLFHRGRFWVALTIWCVELLLSSAALFLGLALLAADGARDLLRLLGVAATLPGWVPSAPVLLLLLVVPHLALSAAVAIGQRRMPILIFAPAFVLLAVLDAWLGVAALVRSFSADSTGQWRSPARRANEPERQVSPSTAGARTATRPMPGHLTSPLPPR